MYMLCIIVEYPAVEPVATWLNIIRNIWSSICIHNRDVMMSAMASQTVGAGADQRKYQSSASLAFVRGIHRWHRWQVNSPHKWPVTRKMCPFDDIIIRNIYSTICISECTTYLIQSPGYHMFHLTRSINAFSWHLIFADANTRSYYVVLCFCFRNQMTAAHQRCRNVISMA